MKINHIGYVVRDIDAFACSMPGIELLKSIDDPLQCAAISLFKCGEGPFVELIKPNSQESFTWGFLERQGEGIHHVCYEGVSRSQIDSVLRQYKMLKIRGPMFAPLFDSNVLFAITRQRAIVEFLL